MCTMTATIQIPYIHNKTGMGDVKMVLFIRSRIGNIFLNLELYGDSSHICVKVS